MAEEESGSQERRNWLSECQYMEKYYVPMCRHSGLYQETLGKIVRLVKTHHPEPRQVADFGCGPGLTIDRLLNAIPGIERVDGFDHSVGLANIGVDHFVRLRNALGRRLFFFEGPDGDLTKPMALSRRYDLVVSNNVLFIFTEEAGLRQAVRNLADALAPDGLLVVSGITPLYKGYFQNKELLYEEIVHQYLLRPWRFLFHMVPQLRQKKQFELVNRIVESKMTPELLTRLLEENGLKIVGEEVYYTPLKYRPAGARSAGGIMYAARRK